MKISSEGQNQGMVKQFIETIQEINEELLKLKEKSKNGPGTRNAVESSDSRHIEAVKKLQQEIQTLNHYHRELVSSQTEIWTEINKIKEILSKSKTSNKFQRTNGNGKQAGSSKGRSGNRGDVSRTKDLNNSLLNQSDLGNSMIAGEGEMTSSLVVTGRKEYEEAKGEESQLSALDSRNQPLAHENEDPANDPEKGTSSRKASESQQEPKVNENEVKAASRRSSGLNVNEGRSLFGSKTEGETFKPTEENVVDFEGGRAQKGKIEGNSQPKSGLGEGRPLLLGGMSLEEGQKSAETELPPNWSQNLEMKQADQERERNGDNGPAVFKAPIKPVIPPMGQRFGAPNRPGARLPMTAPRPKIIRPNMPPAFNSEASDRQQNV